MLVADSVAQLFLYSARHCIEAYVVKYVVTYTLSICFETLNGILNINKGLLLKSNTILYNICSVRYSTD